MYHLSCENLTLLISLVYRDLNFLWTLQRFQVEAANIFGRAAEWQVNLLANTGLLVGESHKQQ